jgi:hypothetical protein
VIALNGFENDACVPTVDFEYPEDGDAEPVVTRDRWTDAPLYEKCQRRFAEVPHDPDLLFPMLEMRLTVLRDAIREANARQFGSSLKLESRIARTRAVLDHALPFPIPHSPFRIPHSAFRIPHSAFRIPHSAFRISHFAFCISQPTSPPPHEPPKPDKHKIRSLSRAFTRVSCTGRSRDKKKPAWISPKLAFVVLRIRLRR